MSHRRKRVMVEAIQSRCLQAAKKEKNSLLDEFVATSGYHLNYAIRLMKHGHPVKRKKRARKIKNIHS